MAAVAPKVVDVDEELRKLQRKVQAEPGDLTSWIRLLRLEHYPLDIERLCVDPWSKILHLTDRHPKWFEPAKTYTRRMMLRSIMFWRQMERSSDLMERMVMGENVVSVLGARSGRIASGAIEEGNNDED